MIDVDQPAAVPDRPDTFGAGCHVMADIDRGGAVRRDGADTDTDVPVTAPPVVTVTVPVPMVFAMMASQPETVFPVATSTLPPLEPPRCRAVGAVLPAITPPLVILIAGIVCRCGCRRAAGMEPDPSTVMGRAAPLSVDERPLLLKELNTPLLVTLTPPAPVFVMASPLPPPAMAETVPVPI